MKNYSKIIRINPHSIIPKYLQLADSILDGVKNGEIAKNEILPSLHLLCSTLDVSKNTVEKAYNTLKKRGIVGSFKGKGFYILSP